MMPASLYYARRNKTASLTYIIEVRLGWLSANTARKHPRFEVYPSTHCSTQGAVCLATQATI